VSDLKPLFAHLVRVETALWDAVDARLRRELDLRLRDFLPLRVIAGTDSCRVRGIVAELGTTVGTASKTVDRLERAGHCARRDNPRDRRSPIIELTPSGRALLDRATDCVDQELELRLAAVLPGPTLRHLCDALARLHGARPAG
jgi:MarR family transcriptional regulator, organic hydroperoxide resistance regulator